MDAVKMVNQIQSRDDFVAFVRTLRRSFEEEPSAWEHQDLGSYLEALAAWAEDMDGYFHHKGEPVPKQPSWKLLGQMLAAARLYE